MCNKVWENILLNKVNKLSATHRITFLHSSKPLYFSLVKKNRFFEVHKYTSTQVHDKAQKTEKNIDKK